MTPEEMEARPLSAAEFFSHPGYDSASTDDRLAALDKWAAHATEWVRLNDPGFKPTDRAAQTAKIREMRAAILDGKKIGEMASDTMRDVGVSLAASGLSATAAATGAVNAAFGQVGDINDVAGLLGNGIVRILDRLGERRETTDPDEVDRLAAEGFTARQKAIVTGPGGAPTMVRAVDRREKLDQALVSLKTGIDNGDFPEEPEAFVDWLRERNTAILQEAARYNDEPTPEAYTDQETRRFDGDLELQGLLSTYARTRNDAAFAEITRRLTATTRREEADADTARIVEESAGVIGEMRDRGATLDGPLAGPLRSLLQAPGVSDAAIEATGDPVEMASTVVSAILTGGTAKAVAAAAGAGRVGRAATVAANTAADVAIEAGTEAFQAYVEDSRGDIVGAAKQGGLVGLAFQLTGAALGGAKRAGAAVGRKAITAALGDTPAKYVVDDRIFVPDGDGWREILPKGREAEGSIPYDAAADPIGLQVMTRLEAARVKRTQAPAPMPPGDAVDNRPAETHTGVDVNPTPALESALAFLRGMDAGTRGEASPTARGERPASSGDGARRAGERSLAEYAQADGSPVVSEQWLESLEELPGGNEHEVYRDPTEPRWLIKVTGPGLALATGKDRIPPISEEGYLERWRLGNEVFGDGAELIGVIPSPGGIRIVMRQPEVEAADPENPHPTPREISDWMHDAGFEYESGAWVRVADGVVVNDAHAGNFIKTERGIRPIDVDVSRTADAAANDTPVILWADNPANPDRGPAGTSEKRTAPDPTGSDLQSDPISSESTPPPSTPLPTGSTPPPVGPGGGPGASSVREWRTRNAYRRFAKDERLDETGRAGMGDPDAAINPYAKYVPITNRDTVETIKKKIDANGVVATAQGFLDGRLPDGTEIDQDLTGAQQSALAQLLLLKLNEALRDAKRAGLQEDVDGLADLMADIAAAGAEIGTDAGQTVQAFSMWSRLGPDGVLRRVAKAVKEKVKKTIKEKIKKDTGKKTEALLADVEAAIAEADAESAPTEEMDSREAARLIQRFAKIQSDTMEWAKGKGAAPLTKLMGDHIKSPLPDFIDQAKALGASQSQAEILDRIAGTERASRATVADARSAEANVPSAEEAAQRAIQRFADAFSDTPTWRDPRRVAGVAGLLRDYFRQPFPDLEARLIALGVKPETAPLVKRLADEEARRRAAATRERERVAREKRVSRLLDDLRPKKGSARNLALNDKVARERFLRTILRARENGVLDSAEFQDAYAEAFGYRLTPAVIDKLTRLAEEALAAPEGFIKQDKARQLLAEVAHVEGIAIADVAVSMWYANLLSGVNTQAVNLVGSGLHLITRLGAAMAVDPRASGAALSGMIKALPVATRDAIATLKDSREAVKMHEKYGKPGALELLASLTPDQAASLPAILRATRPLAKVMRYVFRALAAGDMFWYRTASEGRAYLAASRIARAGGAHTKAEIAAKMAEQLHGGADALADARAQAVEDVTEAYGTAEGRQRDVERRTFEILEQRRPDSLRDEAHQWATLVTFTGDPDGLLGQVAKGINYIVNRAVIPTRFGDIPVLRPAIPFVNIVANVANAAADYTPIGFVRAVNGAHLVAPQREFSSMERKELMMSSVLGSGAATLVAGMAEAGLDDDDPAFAIYAEGPKDANKRRQMMAAGWRPYSIKMGDVYVKFHETPLAIPLSIIGAWHDMRRFSPSYATKGTLDKLAALTAASFGAFSETGFLTSVSDLMKMLQGDTNVGDFAARSAKGFIPFQGLLRDVITRPFDAETIESDSMWAKFIWDVPFVQHLGTRPALNAFGEPIVRPIGERVPVVSRFASSRTSEPEWRWLAVNQLWIPGGADDVTISLANATTRQKKALETIREERAAEIGRFAANVMTDDERHEYVQRSGARIKAEVQRLMKRYPVAADDDRETVQNEINEATGRIRREVKMEMLGLGPGLSTGGALPPPPTKWRK